MPQFSPSSSRNSARRARLARLRAGRLGDGRLGDGRLGDGRLSALDRISRRQKKLGALPGAPPATRNGGRNGARVSRGVGAVVLLTLAGLGIRGIIGQRLDITGQIERAVRAKYIPQLEKQLGQHVEVGEFSTDLLGRVTVHDVVIGRNANLPTGALIRAKSLTIGLDIIGLALGREKPLDAVNRVTIQSPQVYLERLPDGKFNLQSLLPPKKPGAPKTVWTGQVVVNDGRIFYFDRLLTSHSGRKFKADLTGIEATVNARGENPYQADAKVGQIALPDGSMARDVNAQITLELAPNHGWIRAQFPPISAALLTDFALPKGEAVAQSGAISGQVQVAIEGKQFTPRGDLQLNNINLIADAVREPLGGQAKAGPPLRVENLNGPLRFANRAFETSGVAANVLGASWTARGSAALEKNSPLFDVQIATPNVPVQRILSWAKAGAIPVNWQSDNVGLSAHLSGSPADARISGALEANRVRVQSNGLPSVRFDAATSRLIAAFVAQARQGEPVKFAARALLPRVQGDVAASNGAASNIAGSGALTDLELTARGGGGPNSPLEISARAASWNASSPRYGQTSGRALNVVASTRAIGNPSFAGNLSASNLALGGVNLNAFSPDAARLVREIGRADTRVTFADLGKNPKTARATANVTLSRVAIAPAALPAQFRASVPASALTLQNLRARIGVAGGKIVIPNASASGGFGGLRVNAAGGGFAVELPDVRLTAAQINPFLRARGVAVGGDWRGRVAVSGAGPKTFNASFALFSDAVTVRDRRSSAAGLRLDGPSIRGQVRVQPGGAYRGEAVVAARQITARRGSLGPGLAIPVQLAGARAVGLRLNANFAPRQWAARLDVTRAAVPVPGAVATVEQASVLAQSEVGNQGDIVRLTRLSAKFAGGQFDGTGALERGKVSARVLARGVEAGALQRLLAAKSLREARLRGQVSALLAIENGGSPSVQAQLANGNVTLVKSGVVVPIDVAKARLTVAGQTATVRSATLWSDGARFSGAGQIDLSGQRQGVLPAASGTLQVDALRLANWTARLQRLGVPGLNNRAFAQAALDGIVNGDFSLTGGATPRVEGTVELRAGTAFGGEIQRSTAHLAATQTGGGIRLAVSDWTGRVEGAPFEGALSLDTVGNTWNVRLKTDDLNAGRAARLRALSARTSAGAKINLLPIEGDLSADVNVSGVLKPAAPNDQPFFVPRTGYARLVARDVAWQGRPVGTLRANLEVDGNLARIQTLELEPTPNASGNAATPRFTASGTVPLSPDAPGLNVSFELGEAPLQFFVDAARDTRDALSGSGVTQTALDKVVSYADALPPGTRGNIAMRASVGGTLRRPKLDVPTLTLRDGRAPLPYGGFSPPATLDAAFSYNNGAVTVNQGEFRLQKTAAQREGNANDNDDDTLLRIEPGASVDINGEISLAADVFNANLSQLATWVPALRGENNAPAIRGELSEFSLRLSGQTRAPDVIGSIQTENLMFKNYTVDRLRLARFDIKDGKLEIAPGNFTVAKGAYQSSAASGVIGWDWARGGPLLDGPINVNFPVQTGDFAALAGLFVPALSQVGADEFSGGVQVVGTLANPKLSGQITLKDARFALSGPNVAAPVGLKNVNGTIRFTSDERIEIDADDPLRGTLASAASIQAPSTQAATAQSKKVPRVLTPPLTLAGDWKLQGGIGLDLSAESLSNIPRAIGRQKYDLAFSLANAAVSSPQLAGARAGDVAVLFKTGDDGTQRLRWMMAANGRRKDRQSRGGGQMVSIGSLLLRPDFASGTDALLRSTAQEFGTADDFANFAVAKRVKLEDLPDRRPQIKLDKFEWNYTGVGSGEVDGRVVLDNRDAIQQAPKAAVELRNARRPSLQDDLKNRRTSQLELPTRVLGAAQMRPLQLDTGDNPDLPLRVGGQLTLQNATITGAPTGGDGVVTRLSLFPSAPRFDVRLILGEKVEFVTSAFSTGLEGELVASGVPSNPQILGTVQTRNGQVRFPNARARVTQGRVTVAITRDPATDLLRTRVDIDATATGRAGRYLITLGLSGPLDLSGEGQNLHNLRVEVSSDPPLSQSEAFAQLLGTAPRAGSGGFASTSELNQAYAGAVLQVLSAPLFSGVERSVAQALGLDSVSFEYRFDEPLAVQFSKSLTDRVFVTYRRSFGAASGTSTATNSGRTPFELSIEYQIKGNLSLGLKTDESRVTTLTLGKTYRF